MEIVLLLALVAGIAWVFMKRKSVPPQPIEVVGPLVRVQLSSNLRTGAALGGDEQAPRDVGPLTPAGAGTWVLNPASPLPLTLTGADQALAVNVRGVLGRRAYWTENVAELALLVAQHNLRFKEIDAFAKQQREAIDAYVQRAIASSAEWPIVGERDRDDLRASFRDAAWTASGYEIGRVEIGPLMEGEPADFRDDDTPVARFDGNARLYAFYLSALGRATSVVNVKADDWSRTSWESLVALGLALRGTDIPTATLLEGLRLKDLNELMDGAIPKAIGRKAKAIETALSLPDLPQRLTDHVAIREMFQVVPPPGLDLLALGRSFGFATAVATLAQQTFCAGVKTLDAIDEKRRDPDFYSGWEIANYAFPDAGCAKRYCKDYARLPSKLPPFHVGCSCELSAKLQRRTR